MIALLRRAELTVEEMAAELGVTDNAVRAQLATLERDGQVHQHGVRRGSGKPSYSYALTPEFEPFLSRAYIPLLLRLLRELSERMSQEEMVAMLREVGRKWAGEVPQTATDLKSRAIGAKTLLNELGGVTELEEQDGQLIIRGYSCPLAVAVHENPRVCAAVQELLTQLTGVSVTERCDRTGDRARCCFLIGGENGTSRPG